MTERPDLQWNNDEIAGHLKSAMDTLTPDVLDKIDLGTPQDYYNEVPKITKLYRRMRTAATVAAACLCVAVIGSGVALFQNTRVKSAIGIDVNPSIELSVNRNDKVLKAEAINGDAAEILDDMDLKNVDLDIAVNAVIGSMVRHGYLEGTDNTILVTVSGSDKEKAAELRQNVVGDIENSLEEHKLSAVVYDQQADVNREVKAIAGQYDISYGKAYFLQELVKENNLTEEELSLFADMTMEEISKEIAERSYNVRSDDALEQEKSTSSGEETRKFESTVLDTTAASIDSLNESGEKSTGVETVPPVQSSTASQTAASIPETAASAPQETTEETSSGSKKARIDYVDYDDGIVNIVFKDKVKWKNAAVSVTDENGESYSAKITDTSQDSCELSVSGLPGGMSCTFTLSGVAVYSGSSFGTVKGYFDTPDMADSPLPQEPETTEAAPETTKPPQSETPVPSLPAEPAETGETKAVTETEPENISSDAIVPISGNVAGDCPMNKNDVWDGSDKQ